MIMTRLMRAVRIGTIGLAAILMTACATQKPVAIDYTAFKASKPRSILVMPPVNQSPEVAASLSMLSVATMPLAEAGYYVMPVTLVHETFKQNGITVADDAQNVSLGKLRQIFGADAALYITVSNYGASYRILDSVVEVKASAKLVDLRTGAQLWQGSAAASSAEDNNSNNSGGVIGLLVAAVVKQIINSTTDQGHVIANRASQRLLAVGHAGGLLYGPYNPKYGTD
jgi:hypothetical protein